MLGELATPSQQWSTLLWGTAEMSFFSFARVVHARLEYVCLQISIGRKKYGRNRLNKIQLNVPWAKDRVLSDVDPREGFDPTHLPSAPRHGVAHAQAASCHRPQASRCHPSRAGYTRHAAHYAKASRSSSFAGHWAARDARITAWNAKDASSQIEKIAEDVESGAVESLH